MLAPSPVALVACLVSHAREVQPCLSQRVEQQHSLAPGCIDLVPLHRAGRRAAQAEAGDSREGALVPNVEGVVVHVGMPQALKMSACLVDLHEAKAMRKGRSLEQALVADMNHGSVPRAGQACIRSSGGIS